MDLPKPVLRPGSVGPTYLPLTQMMPFALQRSWTLHDLSYKSILLSMFHKVVLNPHHLLCICLTVRGHFCPNNSVSVTNSVFYASHHNLQLYLSPILVFLLGFVFSLFCWLNEVPKMYFIHNIDFSSSLSPAKGWDTTSRWQREAILTTHA